MDLNIPEWLIAESVDGRRQFIVRTVPPRFVAEIIDNEFGGNDILDPGWLDESPFDAACLAKLIRQIIIKRKNEIGWSDYELAKQSGLRPHQISRWLNDQRADHQPTVSTHTLEPILESLGLTVQPIKSNS